MTLNNAIILSGITFGSFYMFSVSLYEFNKTYLKGHKFTNCINTINGIVMITSGFSLGCIFYRHILYK